MHIREYSGLKYKIKIKIVLCISDIAAVLPHAVCKQEIADDIVIDSSDHDSAGVCAVLTTAVTRGIFRPGMRTKVCY